MSNLKTILDACLRVYGADFRVNNRKRENVYARAAFYKVCKINTKQTLESIGAMCGKDHATVLHVTKDGGKHEEYLLIKDYRAIFELFKSSINKLLILKNESEIKTYYDDLNYKIETLENENQELRKDIYNLKTKPIEAIKEPIQERITKIIMGLPDDTLEDFEKYRLNPYLKLQESKINH